MVAAASRRGAGRPRRFDDEAERAVILEAATAVMRRNAYAAASVQDILGEADLSTSAFYRHFDSKDDLVWALYRRDAESAARRVAARVDEAGSAREALEAWTREVLGFGFDPRWAERAAMIRSEVARTAAGFPELARYATELVTGPLVATLAGGKKDGSFPLTTPRRDALTIHAMTLEIRTWPLDGRFRLTWAAAVDQVLRFTLPGLGWSDG